MYVISAMIKYNSEDEAEQRFASYDLSASESYQWEPQSEHAKHFTTIEEAALWYARHAYFLTCNKEYTISGITIAEIVYNPVESLSLKTSVFGDTSSSATNPLAGKSMDDVRICPTCGSDHCEGYDADELDFRCDNTGHYFENCYCKDCNRHFRLYTRFKYELTDVHT